MPQYKTIIGVTGLAINHEDKFLLTLRNDPTDPNLHLKWHIPGGGMEFGEQPEETLNREIREELGVVPVILTTSPIVKSFKYPRLHILILCYPISIGKQTLQLDQTENIDFRWFSLAELPQQNLVRGVAEFVQTTYELRIPKGNSSR